MLVGELIEDLLYILDVIAKDCGISDRLFTTLHPHLATMIFILLFIVNLLIVNAGIIHSFLSYSLLLVLLNASCLVCTDSAGVVQLSVVDVRC